ncbi:MAG: hypothetical protein JW746_01025 [Candidatus Krumholzibacteriota bacterium]|nr:hypothetical protein [Candidatus Krumholzibacteriota bacterium]
MRFKAELWVRLKVADLVAQTAWMTLTEKLDFSSDLHGIVRYSYWGFDAEGESAEKVIEDLDRVVRLDSSFTNQNKHLYLLRVTGDTPGADSITAGDLPLDRDYPVHDTVENVEAGNKRFACDLLVREHRNDRAEGFVSRLESRLKGTKVSGMKVGEVWRLIVNASGDEDAVRKAENMAVTRSRREGVLLNPHYQTSELVGISVPEE